MYVKVTAKYTRTLIKHYYCYPPQVRSQFTGISSTFTGYEIIYRGYAIQ